MVSVNAADHNATDNIYMNLFSTVGETEEQRSTVYMLLDQVMNMRDTLMTLAYFSPDIVSHI